MLASGAPTGGGIGGIPGKAGPQKNQNRQKAFSGRGEHPIDRCTAQVALPFNLGIENEPPVSSLGELRGLPSYLLSLSLYWQNFTNMMKLPSAPSWSRPRFRHATIEPSAAEVQFRGQ